MNYYLLVADLKGIRLPRPDLGTLSWVLLAIAFFAMIFVLIYAFMTKKEKQKQEDPWAQFKTYILNKGFNSDEENQLKALILEFKISNPLSFVKNHEVFTKCVEKKIKELKSKELKRDQLVREILVFTRLRKKLGFNKLGPNQKLISTREIDINTTFNMEVQEEDIKKVYTVKVADVDDLHIALSTPKEKGRYVKLSVNTPINVYFWRDGDAVYSFSSSVLSQMEMPVPLFFIDHSVELKRLQRRAVERVDVNIPVKFTHIPKQVFEQVMATKNTALIDNLPQAEGTLLDVSAGGVSIFAKGDVRANDYANMVLKLPESEKSLAVLGKVLSADDVSAKNEHVLHIEFLGLSEEKRAELARMLYQ